MTQLIPPEHAAARLRAVLARLPLWEAGECSKYADLIEWQAARIRELEGGYTGAGSTGL